MLLAVSVDRRDLFVACYVGRQTFGHFKEYIFMGLTLEACIAKPVPLTRSVTISAPMIQPIVAPFNKYEYSPLLTRVNDRNWPHEGRFTANAKYLWPTPRFSNLFTLTLFRADFSHIFFITTSSCCLCFFLFLFAFSFFFRNFMIVTLVLHCWH